MDLWFVIPTAFTPQNHKSRETFAKCPRMRPEAEIVFRTCPNNWTITDVAHI
jgi:hypothetical protein